MRRIGRREGALAQSVLVAEDERNLVEALSFLMRRAGYRGQRRPRRADRRSRWRGASSPDLVLLDIMLPGFDGFEVVAAIRREAADKPPRIIMLTAKGHEKDRRKALELGVDDYVTKPFSNRDVVERVRALLVVRGRAP